MKKLLYLFSSILCFMFLTSTVFAYTFEVSTTSSSVTAGNSVTLNISLGDAAGKLTISSSDSSVVSVSKSSVWIDNSSDSVTLTGNKAGSATIYIAASDVTTYGGESVQITKSVQITVNPQPIVSNNPPANNTSGNTYVPAKTKSANNFLSSLTIDGFELSEAFDKEKLEYYLEVPALTEKIKINAQLEDSNSQVTGVGEVGLTAGINNFEIVVIAENGSKRTYTLKVDVLELEPLKVAINKEEWTIVRDRKDLPKISEYFLPVEIKIGENTVDGYHNDSLGYDVVGLKNSKGNIEYYIYKNGRYTLYKEYTFNGTTLQILDKDVNNGYKKTSFKYDGDDIVGYQEVKLDLLKNTYALDNNDITGNQFYLFYGKNVETGKEYLYQYDALEKTVQRYNVEVLDMIKKNSSTYYIYLLGSILLIGILIILLVINMVSKHKLKEKLMAKEIEFDEEENEKEIKNKKK